MKNILTLAGLCVALLGVPACGGDEAEEGTILAPESAEGGKADDSTGGDAPSVGGIACARLNGQCERAPAQYKSNCARTVQAGDEAACDVALSTLRAD